MSRKTAVKPAVKKKHRGRTLPAGALKIDRQIFVARREKSGLTEDELATKMRVSRRAIIQWENGERVIHPAFDLLADLLLSDAKPKPKPKPKPKSKEII